MSAEKARKTLLGIEIPRDELALRIAIQCMGVKPPAGSSPAAAFAEMNKISPGMADDFFRAADAAVLYFHEQIAAARQPS